LGANYVVVGDTYVYGIMLGEMMDEAERERRIPEFTFQ
jgi:hypothetical protein